MDLIALDNHHTRTSRLHTMHGHTAAAESGVLDAFDAGNSKHVASFLRESRTDNEWWRVHMFVSMTGDTVYYTHAHDGETYVSTAWGDFISN